MLLLLVALPISLIPEIALYLWIRGRLPEDEEYRTISRNAFVKGVLGVFPVVLFSGVTWLALRLTGIHHSHPLLYEALYTFIVLALVEELVKYGAFRKLLRDKPYPHSWLALVVLMVTVSIGFALLECVIYAIGASLPVILVRGICFPHVSNGFIVGYFYAKSLKTGRPRLAWTGLALSTLIHGMYDFSLSEEFIAINDNLVAVPFLIVLFDLTLVVMLIRFVRKARKNREYLQPLVGLGSTGDADGAAPSAPAAPPESSAQA